MNRIISCVLFVLAWCALWHNAFAQSGVHEHKEYQTRSTQATYSLLFEPSWAAIAGAETQMTLHRAIIEVEGKFLPARLFDESSAWTKAAGISYRLAKAIVLDNNIDYLPIIIQHEAFGHAARFREFGKQGISIQINLGPPYGNASGFATYRRNTRANTLYEDISETIAGVEATQRLSQTIIMNWMQRGKIHYHQMFTAMIAMNDLPMYALLTHSSAPVNTSYSNDMQTYCYEVNSLYARAGYSKYITIQDLQQQSLLALLNPWQYFIAYGYAKEYTWEGNEEWAMPTVSFGNVRYLPALRVGLGITGVEGFLENFFGTETWSGLAYYRQTLDSPLPGYGIGAEFRNVMLLQWLNLGFKFDVWSQPALFLGSEQFSANQRMLGISLTAMPQLWFSEYNGHRVGVIGHLGYKTRGFIPNEPLEAGFMLRVGICFAEK